MMMMRRLLGLALALAAPVQAPAQAQVSVAAPTAAVSEQTTGEALAQDAVAYAAFVGVDQTEGEWRLRAQEASVALTDALRDRYRDRLAGIAIEQLPDFRVVVLLTGDAPVADQPVSAGGVTVPVVFRTGATASLAALKAALAAHQADIRAALAHPPGMGIDQRSGELVVVVAAADLAVEEAGAMAARLGAIAGVPVRVRSIDRPGVDQAGAGAAPVGEGGMRLVGSIPGDAHRYLCTAGFVVTDGTRTGVATAAHCPDTLGYVDAERREHTLAFVGQWGWGYQDVQVNLADEPLAPAFYADTARTVSRPVEGQRGAGSMRAGDVVCHRGERTGYSCGMVELTDFAPAGDLCGGACSPTWLTVAGPQCGGGDSGAPVFVGTTALGLLKGGSYRADGSCGFYFYMSVDYLPTGWRLLMAQPATDLAAPPPPAIVRRTPNRQAASA
jgi:hypothetical protein